MGDEYVDREQSAGKRGDSANTVRWEKGIFCRNRRNRHAGACCIVEKARVYGVGFRPCREQRGLPPAQPGDRCTCGAPCRRAGRCGSCGIYACAFSGQSGAFVCAKGGHSLYIARRTAWVGHERISTPGGGGGNARKEYRDRYAGSGHAPGKSDGDIRSAALSGWGSIPTRGKRPVPVRSL